MAKVAKKPGADSRKALTVTAIVVAVAAAVTAGLIIGIGAAWKSISARPEFLVNPADVALDTEWVQADNMKKDFLRTAPRTDKYPSSVLGGSVSIFQRDLAADVARAYRASPWVRRVVLVRKEFPNRLEVNLDLRLPYAVIKRGSVYTCVSEDGFALDPKLYRLTPDRTCGLTPVIEVPSETKPPVVRKEWDDPAIEGGLAMLQLCKGPLVKLPVSLISIEAQKPAPSSPVLYMAWLSIGTDKAPDKGPLVQWGRAPNCPVSDFEANTQTKINSLLAVVAREKQNFWRFKQIDVRDAQVRCEE